MMISRRGLGQSSPCASGQYAVYQNAAGQFDATAAPVCKPCLVSVSDPLFPNGCPAGFSLQPSPYALSGCVAVSCQDANGKSPIQATTCGPDLVSAAWLAGGFGGFFLLDGWWKLLGVIAFANGLLESIGYHMQAEVQTDGSVKCVRAVTSW